MEKWRISEMAQEDRAQRMKRANVQTRKSTRGGRGERTKRPYTTSAVALTIWRMLERMPITARASAPDMIAWKD